MADVSAEEALKQIEHLAGIEADNLVQTLTKQDDLVPIVLRFHLLTEHQLERIIVASVRRGDRLLENLRLTYRQKLEIVHALDVLPDYVIGALRKLNELRDALSHRRDASVGPQELDSLGRPLGRPFRQITRQQADLKMRTIMTFAELDKPLISMALKAEHADLVTAEKI
jgi:hypothetical protein